MFAQQASIGLERECACACRLAIAAEGLRELVSEDVAFEAEQPHLPGAADGRVFNLTACLTMLTRWGNGDDDGLTRDVGGI